MNVNPLIQIKEAICVFVVAFGLTWFGLSSSVHAVSPPPEGGYPDEIAGFSARQARTGQEQNLTPPAGLKPVEQEAWLAMARRQGASSGLPTHRA